MRRAAAFVLGLVIVASACGSDESGGSSGGKCSQGATRACLGPGACDGAQSCGADGTWGACDCGGSGGAGGGSGAGGSSGAAGDSGVGGSVGGASGSSGSGGSGVDGGAGSTGCPSGKGPAMVSVGTFCVDTTEVTQAQYAEFVSAKGSDTTGQPTKECDWNTSYQPAFFSTGTPEANSTGCNIYTPYDPTKRPTFPVSCVDWCDARAFCAWAGKRLCGALGGGPLDPFYGPADPTAAEWPFVATNGGTDTSQYGSYGVDAKCVVGPVPIEPVKNRPDCHGKPAPYDVVFDLSGNVAEFADDCDPGWGGPGGPTAQCAAHGGGAGSPISAAQWSSVKKVSRNAVGAQVGFRCCANLVP